MNDSGTIQSYEGTAIGDTWQGSFTQPNVAGVLSWKADVLTL